MKPHARPHSHLHIQIESDIWQALSKLHPSYGERSQVIRKLVQEHLAGKAAPKQEQPNE